MKIRLLLLVAALLGVAGRANPAQATLVLSFDQASYSIAAPGGTTAVSVYVNQVPGGTQVTTTDGLATAAIRLSFNTPGGIADVASNSAVAPAVPPFDVGIPSVSATNAVLDLTSLGINSMNGVTIPGQPGLLLGTFTFTGLSLGTTTLTVSRQGLNSTSVDFITTNVEDVDPTNTATATLTVGGGGGVPTTPEPASLVSAATAVLLTLGGLRWRSRRG